MEAGNVSADTNACVPLRRRGLQIGPTGRPSPARLRGTSVDTSVAARGVRRSIEACAPASSTAVAMPCSRIASPRTVSSASLDAVPSLGPAPQLLSLVPKPIPVPTTRCMWQPTCAPAFVSRVTTEQAVAQRCPSRKRMPVSSVVSFVGSPNLQEAPRSVHGVSAQAKLVVPTSTATAMSAQPRSCTPTRTRALIPMQSQSSVFPRLQPPPKPLVPRSRSPSPTRVAVLTPSQGTALLQTTTIVRHKIVYELTPVPQEPDNAPKQMEIAKSILIPDVSAAQIDGRDDFCPEKMVRLRCGNFSTADVSSIDAVESLNVSPRHKVEPIEHIRLRCGAFAATERPMLFDNNSVGKVMPSSPEDLCGSPESSVKTLTPNPPEPRGSRLVQQSKIGEHNSETCKTQ